MSTTPRRSKGSHGPVIALLVGIALVVVASCGGAFYLISTSMAGMARMIEERNGPREHTDEDYRVRVRLPDGTGWELLSGELASSFDADAILVIRGEDCVGAVLVVPAPGSVPLATRLEALYDEQTRQVPGVRITGLDEPATDLVDSEDGAVFATAFLHGGILYRLSGDGSCLPSLRAGFELLPGEVRARRVRAPIEEATGRSYRIHARVFESAASGLVVDATEPFAPIVEDAWRLDSTAEIVVIHANGTQIGMDPFHRTAEDEADDAATPGRETVELVLGEQTVRFERLEGDRYELFGCAHLGALSVYVSAEGADAASVREALEAVAPRLRSLGPESLALLRTELGTIRDRRAGEGWSLRDGTFREHPSEPRASVALYVPAWTAVVAGKQLAARADDGEAVARLVVLERRDLGVSAQLTVGPTTETDAATALEARVAALGVPGLTRLAPPEVDRVGRARGEVSYDLDAASRNRMTVVTQVQGGWLFRLEAWRHEPEHPEARRFVDELAEGFVVEPPPAVTEDPRRHRDERLGFELHAPSGVLEVEDLSDWDTTYVEAIGAACALDERRSLCVLAASDVTADDALLDAVDWITAERSVGAIWALPATARTLDDRPAQERSFWDEGQEVRVVTTSIDRTVYVAVARGAPRTDWRSVFDRIDLDP